MSYILCAVCIILSVANGLTYYQEDLYGVIEMKHVFEKGSDLGSYQYAAPNFGPNLPKKESAFKGIVHKAEPEDGCEKLQPPPSTVILPAEYNWVALIQRSKLSLHHRSCQFIEKVLNAQASGYALVIIYDSDPSGNLIHMQATNDTLKNMVQIPSVFISYSDGEEISLHSYPDMDDNMTGVTFIPDTEGINPYKILLPLAFSFVGILLITCIVMIFRWCQAIRRKRRSRVSKSQLKKIPINSYHKGDQYDTCAICLEEYEEGEKLRLLPCKHTFHQKCIDPWLLKNKRTCPVCKRKVISRPPGQARRPSETSSESEAENERTPLLPPPAGRTPEARHIESRPSLGTSYGSVGGSLPEGSPEANLSRSSDDEESGVTSRSASNGLSYLVNSPYEETLTFYRRHMRRGVAPSQTPDHISVHSLQTIPDTNEPDTELDIEGAVGGVAGSPVPPHSELHIEDDAAPYMDDDTAQLLPHSTDCTNKNIIV